MSIEAMIKESDSDFALRMLHDMTYDVRWSNRDYRDRSGTGYFQYFKSTREVTPRQVLDVQELNEIGFYKNQQTESHHRFLTSVYSGEVGDAESSDMLTTFGVDEQSAQILVSQIFNPNLDLADPLVAERLSSYKLFGVNIQDESAQWRALIDVLCPDPQA